MPGEGSYGKSANRVGPRRGPPGSPQAIGGDLAQELARKKLLREQQVMREALLGRTAPAGPARTR